MKISRREFMKWVVAVTAALKIEYDFSKLNVDGLESLPSVNWLQGSGCSVFFLNVTDPALAQYVLTSKISLKFSSVVMWATGEGALQELAKGKDGGFILIIEGAVPASPGNKFCRLGEIGGKKNSILEAINTVLNPSIYVSGGCDDKIIL